jgi:hypothetical protein
VPRATPARRPRRPVALAALLAACALAAGIAGCGDGSLSAGDLRTQAGAICARSSGAAAAVALPGSEDGGAAFLHAGVARLRPALTALNELAPPGDMREGYEQALHVRGQELALVAQSERAIARGADAVTTFRSLQTQLTPLENLEDATWRALQVPGCVPR